MQIPLVLFLVSLTSTLVVVAEESTAVRLGNVTKRQGQNSFDISPETKSQVNGILFSSESDSSADENTSARPDVTVLDEEPIPPVSLARRSKPREEPASRNNTQANQPPGRPNRGSQNGRPQQNGSTSAPKSSRPPNRTPRENNTRDQHCLSENLTVSTDVPSNVSMNTNFGQTLRDTYSYFQGFFTEENGNVFWTQRKKQIGRGVVLEWFINVTEGRGIAFDFHNVEMKEDSVLSIHAVNSTSQEHVALPLWSSTDFYLAPLLVNMNTAIIKIKTAGCSLPSSFNLTYSSQPLEIMPERVLTDQGKLRSSRFVYDCSFPKEIPKALRCDMVPQCLSGEDEIGCSYQQKGCEDFWIPYGEHCLRAFFLPIVNFFPGTTHITLPLPAENECKSRFQSELANLPDDIGIKLVGQILRRSGYQSASVGLRLMRPVSYKMRHLYRFMWQWGKRGKPVAYNQMDIQRRNPIHDCSMYDLQMGPSYLRSIPGNVVPSPSTTPAGFICMKKSNSMKPPKKRRRRMAYMYIEQATRPVTKIATKQCSDGSMVQTFHTCEWKRFSLALAPHQSISFPGFQCALGHSIHYTLVCDGHDDCADGSDETNCRPPRFEPLRVASFVCRSSITVPVLKRCNGFYDCFDGSDEDECLRCKHGKALCPGLECIPQKYRSYFTSCLVPVRYPTMEVFSPALVELDGFGMSELKPMDGHCGEGHFRCSDDLCIPTFLLNNGEKDCPDGSDEITPDGNWTCPGYYRCHFYGNCVHNDHVCDGIHHCPNKDDERFCDLKCPQNCTCEGHAYKCELMFNPDENLQVRYLDLSGVSRPNLRDIHVMEYLLVLNISNCALDFVNITDMRQLTTLDLSGNLLAGLTSLSFAGLSGLRHLLLSNNPFIPAIDSTFKGFIFHSGLRNLKSLVLTNTSLCSIEDYALSSLLALTHLDLRGNRIQTFNKNVFIGLSDLHVLYADNYKLCCPYFHPKKILECVAPTDELSSCSDLLDGYFYQVSVWLLACANIPANVAVLVYRLYEVKRLNSKTYTTLVAHLCLSDLLMGIYLIFIGSADVHYRDTWVSHESQWTGSYLCKTAGVLAFLSSEVSALVVCLITVERLLVVCFPLKTHFHMTPRSAMVACIVAWLLGLLLALIPFPVGWAFYGQNGFCLPLPITRNQFPGQKFAFAVFIVFNFVLFILIGLGQVWIYLTIRKIRRAKNMPRNKLQDTTIARRLMLVIVTDFFCWFPVGVMGMMAHLGMSIPGEVNAWAALFILPFNSALNPWLYTLNSVWDRYREQRMERRIKKTIGKIDAEISKWPQDKVELLLRSCLRAQNLHRQSASRQARSRNGNGLELTERQSGSFSSLKQLVSSTKETDGL